MTVAHTWAKHVIKQPRLEGHLDSNDLDCVGQERHELSRFPHQPHGTEIHVIADIILARKTGRVDAFLSAHPRVIQRFPFFGSDRWITVAGNGCAEIHKKGS